MSDLDERRRVGLCLTCCHAHRVETPRSTFWLCRLSATEPRFPKYPRLPVLACDGYRPGEADAAPEDAPKS